MPKLFTLRPTPLSNDCSWMLVCVCARFLLSTVHTCKLIKRTTCERQRTRQRDPLRVMDLSSLFNPFRGKFIEIRRKWFNFLKWQIDWSISYVTRFPSFLWHFVMNVYPHTEIFFSKIQIFVSRKSTIIILSNYNIFIM